MKLQTAFSKKDNAVDKLNMLTNKIKSVVSETNHIEVEEKTDPAAKPQLF